ILERELAKTQDPEASARLRALLDALAQIIIEKVAERPSLGTFRFLDGLVAFWRPDGRQIALTSPLSQSGNAYVIYDTDSWKDVLAIKSPEPSGESLSLRYSPKGGTFAVWKNNHL